MLYEVITQGSARLLQPLVELFSRQVQGLAGGILACQEGPHRVGETMVVHGAIRLIALEFGTVSYNFV